jgi:hypothetical protein
MTPGHGRRPARRGRTLLAALAALLWAAADATAAAAQRPGCAQRLQPQPGQTGYRSRDHRCEGMYVGLQSGSRSIQVISLAKGGVRYDLAGGDTLLFVHVPELPAELGQRAVPVLGSTRETNLNWALDAAVDPRQALRWDLRDVIVPQRLASQRIGMAGQVEQQVTGGSRTVYVPVQLRRSPGATAAADSTELVVRVAVAAGVRWSTQGTDAMRDAERLNVDGYFRIMLPPAAARGQQLVTLAWRVRGEPGWKTPEQLRIYRW